MTKMKKTGLMDGAGSESEEEVVESGHGNTRLPFGLCKRYGINLPDEATPRDAWDALKGRGIYPEDVYKELDEKAGDKPKENEEKQQEQKPINKEELAKKKEQMFSSDRNRYEGGVSRKAIEKNFNFGTEEMQDTTASLFNNDSYTVRKGSRGDASFSPVRNSVNTSPKMLSKSEYHADGYAFYHESWHAIDYNYGTDGVGDRTSLSTSYITSSGKTIQELVTEEGSKLDIDAIKEELNKEKLGSAGIERLKSLKEKKEALIKQMDENRKSGKPFDREVYNEYTSVDAEIDKMEKTPRNLKIKWGDLSDVASGATKGIRTICGIGHDIKYWYHSDYNRGAEVFAEIAGAKATSPESYAVLKKYIPKTVEGFEEIYSKLKNGEIKAANKSFFRASLF